MQPYLWEFNIFAHDPDAPALLGYLAYMLGAMGCAQAYHVPAGVFLDLAEAVREAMSVNDVPYHNFLHAFDVTQAVYAILARTEADGGCLRLYRPQAAPAAEEEQAKHGDAIVAKFGAWVQNIANGGAMQTRDGVVSDR